MDIMRPKLTQVGTMCFRRLDLPSDGTIDVYFGHNNNNSNVNTFKNKIIIHSNDNQKSIIGQNDDQIKVEQPKGIDQLEALDFEEKEGENNDDDGNGIEEISGQNGKRFRIELKITKCFHGLILGKQGSTKNRIQDDTRARIEVPNMTDSKSPVIITGPTRDSVKAAKRRINSIVESMRLKSDFTHFVAIPMNHNSICERFNQFKNEVLNDSNCMKSKGFEESLFQSSNKLHLTIATLFLGDENERKIASQILEECNRDFIKSITKEKPIRVKVEGIDYMNDDPTEVHVIYAKIIDMSENQCLQPIMNDIFDRFEKSKLMTRSHQFDKVSDSCKVKPHLTLINSRYRQTSSNDPKPQRDNSRKFDSRSDNKPKREAFDATAILDRFGNYFFGEVEIETIEISIRYSNGRGKDGYYSYTSLIKL